MLYIVKVFRIAFIGQNGVELGDQGQSDLFNIISGLVDAHDYIEFNSGYGNIFERTAADIAKNILLGRTDKFGAINLWLPYKTSEHIQNRKYYEAFFDRILFCSRKQKKSAHRKRDRELIKYSDLILFCIQEAPPSKKQIRLAHRKKKCYINIA